jgi:radical SAM superfamily enzyme YgiQ (UPF0313 family)
MKKYGHITALLAFNDKKSLRDLTKIKEFNPDIIGITSCTNQWGITKSLTREIKKRFNLKIFAGGSHPTVFPEALLETPAIDGICQGEGEFPFLELVKKLSKGQPIYDTPNFWLRKGNKIIKNEISPLVKNLDDLPMPDWSIFDAEPIYAYSCFSFSRGCAYDCHYCINSTLRQLYKGKGPYIRMKSPERAITEIKDKLNKYDLKVLNFDDDGFVKNKKWISDFCKAYEKEIGLPFNYNSRPEDVSEDVCRMMKASGARLVAIGVESGDPEIRFKFLKRPISDETIVNAFKTAHNAGLKTCSFNMIGIPGETPECFKKTVRINRIVAPDEIQLSVFYPFPGTYLEELCREKGYIKYKPTYGYYQRSVLRLPGFAPRSIQKWYDKFEYLVYKDIKLIKAFKFRVSKFIARHRVTNLIFTPIIKRFKKTRFFEKKIAARIR